MLNSLAQRVHARPLYRHALFLAATVITLLVLGYHFGTFDQFVHIPFLKKYVDPSLFPNDAFIDLRRESYSYFWAMLAPLARMDLENYRVLQWGMFALYIVVTYLSFWGLWELSLLLFNSPPAALLGTLAFAMPHVGFAGFPVFEFSLLNRTFALPFAIFAVLLYLKGRPRWAFLVCGLLFNIHVITVNFLMAMFLLDAAIRWRALGWRRITFGLALFFIGAAPVLIWRLTSPASRAALNPAWFDVTARGSLYNLFFLIAPYLHILFVTASGLSTLALYAIARRTAPAPSAEHERAVQHFILAVIVILSVQAITVLIVPIDLLNQLQIIRVGMWANIFGYLYFAHYLVRRMQAGTLVGADRVILVSAYLGSFLPFIPLLVLAIQTWIASVRWRAVLAAATAIGLFAFAINLVLQLGVWSPGIYPFGPNTAWEQIQRCARERTSKDALFITPPEKWSFYTSDWRTFSERSTVVTHADLLMIALAPGYYDTWHERFVDLAPGAIEKFRGDFFENQRLVREAFYRLPPDELLRLAHKYGADYIVLEQPHTLDLPTLECGNPQYTIYMVK